MAAPPKANTVYIYSIDNYQSIEARPVLTLDDIARSFQVYAVCVPCQRTEPLPVAALIERFGGELPVTALRTRLRCEMCGQRSADMRIVYVGPCGSAAGFHYRR